MMQASPSIRRNHDRDHSRGRRRSPPSYESDRKRYRARSRSPERMSRGRSYSQRSWDREAYENSRRISSQHVSGRRTSSYNSSYRAPYQRGGPPSRRYESGLQGVSNGVDGASGLNQPRTAFPLHHMAQQVSSKSRRLYIGNLPFHAGLTDIALTQFFSAMYIAAFRANRPGEPLPVVSFWLHSDGKFGFMELRGEQEAVNMMQFNGVFLHSRPLRVNRPSDYRPEVHNPAGMNLVPDVVNIPAVMELCEKLGDVVAAPAQLAAIAATQTSREPTRQVDALEQKDSGPAIPKQESQHQEFAHELPASAYASHNGTEKTRAPESKVNLNEKKVASSSASADPIVISLKNLVTDDDLEANDEEYQETISDVQEECSKYGAVEGISIPKTGPWRGTAFVQFRSSAAAKNAMEALRKRVFDGRQIVAVGLKGCKTAEEAATRPQV